MSFYSPNIVYFDIVPPLQYVGSALRERFSHWFDGFEGSIGQEVHDLTIVTSGDVAVASMLIRASGTRKNGDEVGFWVRATSSFQRSDHGWLITHEHVSLPVDLASGSAVTNQLGKLDAALVPEPGLRVMEFGVDRRRYRELKTRLSESVAAALA